MSPTPALLGGVAGAVALTLIHESARKTIPHAPRIDVIGMRAIARPMRSLGHAPPRGRDLRRIALTGDLLSNSAYYALVGVGDGRGALLRGGLLGLVAGIGAALLPPAMGLGRQPGRLTPVTQLLTVAWYTIGGLTAGAVAGVVEEYEGLRRRAIFDREC